MMDENRAAEFTGRVLADSAAAATIVLAALGDRTGTVQGPGRSTAREPAGSWPGRTGLSERYVREWLGGMFAAGYLSYDDAQQRYALPAEHVPTLATEPGPAFFGGVHQELIGAIQRYDQVAEAFRRGGGVRHGRPAPRRLGRDQPVHRPVAPEHARPAVAAAGPARPRPSCGPAPGSPTWAAAPGRR